MLMMDASAKLAKIRNDRLEEATKKGKRGRRTVSEPEPEVTTKQLKELGQDGYEMYMARASIPGFK